MGEVYKARDTRLDRTVAIKVLPEHVAQDPDLKQRFEREAKTVAALSHPNIAAIRRLGQSDGQHPLNDASVRGVTEYNRRYRESAAEITAARARCCLRSRILKEAERRGGGVG